MLRHTRHESRKRKRTSTKSAKAKSKAKSKTKSAKRQRDRKREQNQTENQTPDSTDSHAYFQSELNKQVDILQQQNEDFMKQAVELKKQVVELKKQVVGLSEGEPDHLPELLFRFEEKNKSVALFSGAFLACLSIQFGQLSLARILMADDAIKQVSEIDKWVADGLLDWANGTRSSYNDTDQMEFLATLRNGTLVLTDEGFDAAWRNQVIGILLLWLFLVAEINAIFFKNEYHFKGFAYNGAPAVLVLFLQIIVAFWVAFACSASVMNSSLDTVATIQASLEAFFVLEIDDKLLPVLWTIVAPKGLVHHCDVHALCTLKCGYADLDIRIDAMLVTQRTHTRITQTCT